MREKASCSVCVTRNTQLGNNANDKYSFRFTKFKGDSDSFPILRPFAAYFRPSPQALAITKPKKFHRAILSSFAKGTGRPESLNLKMIFSCF